MPLTTVVLLLGLSGDMTNEDYQSKMTCIYVFIIMSVSFYCGQLVMSRFGISISGLRIAGGMIVGIIGFRMLFPQQPSHKTLEADEKKKEISNNIAFVPLAMPSTAGPGTIAMIISMSSTVKSGGYNVSTWVVYASSIPLLLCIILWFCMRNAGSIMRFMGKSGIEATSKIMGFLLVCVGTQFIINGVKELILSFQNI
ncbi:MarC family NAAT transporter [Gilliamella sp. B3023]|uniref:MarC family NAAT transporter n=1 Tax=Gilliamella sp. B3023 TaxID=2817987 RepID=UPI003A5CDB78